MTKCHFEGRRLSVVFWEELLGVLQTLQTSGVHDCIIEAVEVDTSRDAVIWKVECDTSAHVQVLL